MVVVVVVRKLEATDDISSFASGNAVLDRWFHRHCRGNQHYYGVTYVAVEDGVIVGYVAVSPSSVDREQLSGTGPSSSPVLLIGRLAVRADRQRAGIGQHLVQQAFDLALEQHDALGCAAVIVDAKPEAIDYYADKYAFVPMQGAERRPGHGLRMFLEIGVLVRARQAGQG